MFDILRIRRSIRKYLDKEIEPETIDLLKEAALRSPTSRDIKPWQFLFITDRELLRRLSKAKEHGSSFLGGARLGVVVGVVVCADENESDVWIEDCSIASILLQMTAQSLGLGSCWIQVRNRMFDDKTTSEQYVQSLLRIPEHIKVQSIIAIGYPAESREPLPAAAKASSRLSPQALKAISAVATSSKNS